MKERKKERKRGREKERKKERERERERAREKERTNQNLYSAHGDGKINRQIESEANTKVDLTNV